MNLAGSKAKIQKKPKRTQNQMGESKRRHLLSVTLKKELFDQVKAQALKEDIPATAWARRAILEKLADLP